MAELARRRCRVRRVEAWAGARATLGPDRGCPTRSRGAAGLTASAPHRETWNEVTGFTLPTHRVLLTIMFTAHCPLFTGRVQSLDRELPWHRVFLSALTRRLRTLSVS